MKLKLSNDMKTYLECIKEAADKINDNENYNLFEPILYYLAPILQAAAEIYSEQSNSHKYDIVRGGVIEAQSVPLEGEALKWTNSCVTQNTPTEPLATEALDTVAEAGDWDVNIKPIATAEYKLTVAKIEKIERGGSAKGQP